MVGIKGRTGIYKHKYNQGLQKGHRINNGKILSEEHKEKIRESCRNCPVVHHINGNHFDDRPENRMIVTPSEHAKIHILQGDIKPYGSSHSKIAERREITK